MHYIKKLNQVKKTNRNKHLLIKTAGKFKFKRYKKGHIKGCEYNVIATKLSYGMFGLRLLKPKRLTNTHVTAFRETISRKKLLKKKTHIM